ncbi:LysM peptidoglycan-binding domain-containing protein [Actinotalea sp. Marseille-Q4924]|uniref:LysM peptidoglycan-binding domain-containing protein n=1 Tax=Actinotalea sp. Marseille-Q4924 TaxID=2866571 RepID=UPI001CE414E7|nr:LysM peptidoglycan-binding domain-containing protein [Actinotalea sp. Marseille-Q4924]
MNPTYAPTRRRVRTAQDITRGLGAAAALVAFVVGLPLVLAVVAPLSWPQSGPTWESIRTALTRPDDGSLLLDVIVVIAWLAWAAFSASVTVEVAASLRHVRAPSIPMLGWFQRGAAMLVTTTGLVLSTAAPSLATGVTPVAAAPVSAADVAPSTMTGLSEPMTATPAAVTRLPAAMTAMEAAGAAHEEADRHPVITAARGDTLWSLAERHLGSGHRFTEIRDLNLGRPQPDGGALTDAHWIYPGWQLWLPADATNLPALAATSEARLGPGATAGVHEVVAGDTLWEIAAAHLGDGARYPEIFDLNAGVTQNGGSGLTDPDLIRPGWRLALPVPAEVVSSAPLESPPTVPAQNTLADSPETATSRAPAPPPSAQQHDGASRPAVGVQATVPSAPDVDGGVEDDDAEDARPTRLFLGLTGLAALGVIGELARRRHLQHRTRRTGERIPLPPPGSPTEEAERTLRTATTPLSIPQLKTSLLNLASRAYAAERDLPRIGTLMLSDETIELHLVNDDSDPIPPYEAAGPRTWSAPTAALADDVPIDDDPGRPEPYPALVTVGHTDSATVIVNLEAAGTLVVAGDPTGASDVLRALVTELATSDLTGRIGLIAGPQFAGLAAACDPARLQCVDPGDLTAQHVSRSAAITGVLGAIGVDDTLEARSDRSGGDTWLPVTYVDEAEDAQWTPPAAWSGSVLLTTAHRAGWTLTVASHGSANLDGDGIHFVPSRLTDADLRRIVDLLAAAAPGPGPDGTANNVICDEMAEALAAIPASRAVHSEGSSDTSGRTLQVNVLGPIEIVGLPEGARPLGKRSIELLVYLALRGKATGSELDEVLWRGRRVENQTRNSLLYRTRQRVGVAHLPPVDADGYYRLGREVACDWTAFQDLVRRGYAEGEKGRDALQDALKFVRDRPLCGLAGADYAWAENDIQEMISAIVDAAHVLSASLLAAGKHQGALSAATRGLLAEPCSERLYDDAIRAARGRGDADEAERLTSRLRATLESLDPEYVG